MTRFLCVGDLHLGAGADYGRELGDRLTDQERVWAQTLELAVEHEVDAVLFAGDAFHRHVRTPAELRAFQRPLEAFAAEHDIPILGIPGNHDVESAAAACVLEVFGRDIDVHFEPGLWHTLGGNDIAVPGGVTVATLPWTPVSRLVAARGGGDRDDTHAIAAELLLETARDLRARVDGPAVLMLHWSLTEAVTPTGREVGPDFGVAINTALLAQVGFDAVIAGHIHKAQLLVDGDAPVFYTGSPLPVDFGEANVDHGVWLLDVDGKSTSTTFLPIESRPFITVDADLTCDAARIEVTTPDDGYDPRIDLTETDFIVALALEASFEGAVLRVRYTATEEQARRIDHQAITHALYDAGAHRVYAIQPTIVRENRARVAGVDEEIAPLAAVDAWVCAKEISTEQSAALVDLTSRYLEAGIA